MTDIRFTQVPVEVITVNTPDIRFGHLVLEAVSTDASTLRVTQIGLECLRAIGSPPLLVTQVGLEVLRTTAGTSFGAFDASRMLACI